MEHAKNILSLKEKLLNRINIVCSDLTSLNLDNFLFINQITHYLNFAAIKHVRSEENLDSIQYMIKTNSINFYLKKNIDYKNYFLYQLIKQ